MSLALIVNFKARIVLSFLSLDVGRASKSSGLDGDIIPFFESIVKFLENSLDTIE